jgi:hypothetical protein
MLSTMGRGELLVAVHDAQLALLFNQEQLARVLGSSLRTVQRWYAGRATLDVPQLTKLVFAVYPRDAEIAARLAAILGHSLESLGVIVPPPVVPAPAPPPAPPGPSPLAPVLAESVVAAAAEALDVSPRVARPAVLAAVERAKASGLTIGELLDALRPPPPPPEPPPPAKRAKP